MINIKQNSNLGDAAVDGLLAGLGAGVAMVVYLMISGMVAGEGAGEVLGRFGPGILVTPLAGTLSHLAVSAIYGVFFGVIIHPLRNRFPGWLSGLVYGALLFLVAWFFLLPGSGSPLLELSPLRFGTAHLVYGIVLGWRVSKKSL